jgi:sulfate adenylyltransferase
MMTRSKEQESSLISPYCGSLTNLCVGVEEREKLLEVASQLPRLQLSPRNLCDLELLATGAFSPVDRFLGNNDYRRVLQEMRLANGILFPIPITLSIEPFPGLSLDSEIGLADERSNLLAVMRVEEIYEWDKEEEAHSVCGTTDVRHPFIAEMHSCGRLNISGRLRVLALPRHYDFQYLRLTPAQVRERLSKLGHGNVVAFQTRNPLHRAHEELTRRAAAQINGALLLHPVAGITKPGDIDHYTRVRSYRVLFERYYDPNRTVLALLPLAMRMAGPREAVWHAIIRRNFGANHLIIGRDHASAGKDSMGQPFYEPYKAQEMLANFSNEIGVQPIPFSELVYLPDEDRYEQITHVPHGQWAVSLSGTTVRQNYLQNGLSVPTWFTRPEVAEILVQSHPARHRQGFCLWFTGLSAAGKSTIAEILTTLFLEHGRQVTLLDGDVIRTHLSKGLGFSREHREINIRRIGFVASEIVRHRGVAICAAISPYRATRNQCRLMVGADRFIEVFVDTPLEVCEKRDPKRMYARARAGQIKHFTGIDDPYEPPTSPELVLDTVQFSAEENARQVLSYCIERGVVLGSLFREGNQPVHVPVAAPTFRDSLQSRQLQGASVNSKDRDTGLSFNSARQHMCVVSEDEKLC